MTEVKKQKTKKIIDIVLNVVIWLFVAFSIVVTVFVFAAQGSTDGVPAFFGKSILTIETKSMTGTFNQGDLVFMSKLPASSSENLAERKAYIDANVKAGTKEEGGTIITFRMPSDVGGLKVGDLNTHRVVDIVETPSGKYFVTKGDANPRADNDNPSKPQEEYIVEYVDIVGICYDGGRIPIVGHAISFLRSPIGFFIFIVLPLILFFLYELYNFISIIVTERAKRAPVAKETEEEIKRRAIEEYLQAQNAAVNQDEAAPPSDEAPVGTSEGTEAEKIDNK